jgi:uncharacterized protein YhaN
MIEAWTMQRSTRFFLAGAALVIGFTSAELLIRQMSFATATIIYSMALAALVGFGKLASP